MQRMFTRSVQVVRSTLKVEQVLALVYRLLVLEKSSGADGLDLDSGNGSTSSSRDLVPLSCGRRVNPPGPALTAVL